MERPPPPNDATWRHRFFDTIFWASQGGDFSNTVSGSQSVGVHRRLHMEFGTDGRGRAVVAGQSGEVTSAGWY